MTYAELLRKYATDATNEGGMWFSGEYMTVLASIAESIEAENAKLRKLALDVHALHWSGLDCTECPWIGECYMDGGCPWLGIMADRMREIGIEVDE